MTSKVQVLRSVGPKLVPFFKTVAVFFVLLGTSQPTPSMLHCVTKCLPIISLMIFVLLHGMDLSDTYAYSRKILLGLLFSCVGDAFLVWGDYGFFECGLAAFALAHIAYTSAFGMRPLRPDKGLFCGVICAILFALLYPGLHGIILYLGVMYMSVIFFMGWRAMARLDLKDSAWTWTKLSGFLGALTFGLSDFIIAFDRFRVSLPHAYHFIMITYYAAQLGISLTVVDNHTQIKKKKA